MLRLSKLTDYAVVVLVRLHQAQTGDGFDAVHTTPGIAAATGIPEPTVAKVLKAMANTGLVVSQRGARGGYRLARPLGAVPVSDVIEAIEGRIALAACVDGGNGACEAERLCPVKGRWDPVNEAIRVALSAVTLADMHRGLSTAAAPRPGAAAAASDADDLRPRAPRRSASSHGSARGLSAGGAALLPE